MGNKPLPKLPKKFKNAWVKALRSGKYEQTSSQLMGIEYDDDENSVPHYCCLGVACRVAGYLDDDIKGDSIIPEDFDKVPEILRGEVGDNDLVGRLVEMNDDKDRSFKYIASYVERYL